MKPKYMQELAAIFHEAESPEELLGSLKEWAGNLLHHTPIDPQERVHLVVPLGDIELIETIRTMNYRQQYAMALARGQGHLTTVEVARRFHISMESARLDLRDLVEQGRLLAISDKKGRYYIPSTTPHTSGHQLQQEGVPPALLQASHDTLSYSSLKPEA